MLVIAQLQNHPHEHQTSAAFFFIFCNVLILKEGNTIISKSIGWLNTVVSGPATKPALKTATAALFFAILAIFNFEEEANEGQNQIFISRNLGYFTSYGIEYVYDYLGEKRVNQRIEELKEKPTMGIRLEKFTYGDPENSYISCTGVLDIFTMIIHSWFSDLDFIDFLITNSKKYNKVNYLEGGIIQKKWTDHLAWMDEMIQRSLDKRDYYLSKKINPYWKDLHFFYMQIFKKIEKEDFMFEYYLQNFKEISLRMKQEIHSLTPGQVLSNGCMWKIYDYYKSKGNHQKARDIAKLNNSFDVWRNIPEDEDEYIEGD